MDKKLFFKVFGKIMSVAICVFIVASLLMVAKGLLSTGDANILVMATDKGELLTDTMMLVNINTHTKKLNLLSLPRDTRVTLENGNHVKLNSVYGSEEKSKRPHAIISKVNELTGIKPDYYLIIHPDGFRNVIDALGGVDFDVPGDMDYDDPTQDLHIHLKAGMQHLDGDKAEQYTRFRSGYANADLGRISAQQEFLKALFQQKVNFGTILKTPIIYAKVQSDFDTNMGLDEAVRFAKTLKKFDSTSFDTYQLPSAPKYINGVSYVVQDETATDELISSVFLAKEVNQDTQNNK